MRNNMIRLLVTFFLLLSLHGFSQTTEKSEHPLLDKYYPRKQDADTAKTVTIETKPVPVVKPAPETKQEPAVTAAPPETTTPVITTTVPDATPNPIITTTPAMTTTTTINRPAPATAPAQKVKTQPPPAPYMGNRLGSSTEQYNTWEKNNNGAGSVTTSPK